MKNKYSIIVILLLVILIGSNLTIQAGNVSFQIFSSGLRITQDVKSKTEIKFHNIVKQKYDVSCGSASLATILQYYYSDQVSEQEIINIIKNLKNINTL